MPKGVKNTKITPEKLDELMKPAYKAVLKVNETEIVGEGATLLEAIDALPKIHPKTRGILIGYCGDKSAEFPFFLNILRIKRLFVNQTYREIIASQLFKRLQTV